MLVFSPSYQLAAYPEDSMAVFPVGGTGASLLVYRPLCSSLLQGRGLACETNRILK